MSTATSDGGSPAPAGQWDRPRALMARITQPAPTGLPRWPILLWFPGVLLVLLIVFVALGISGTSSGMFWQLYGSGADPDLLAGTPRGVRSDEWLTFGSWVVSQYSQGFPATNGVFPGGMDMTVLLDLPTWDWSTLFRPQSIGFMLFGLDHGMAVRWWLPGLGMVAACYCMAITLVPRRPVTSAVVAVAFFYSPLLHWWYAPSILLPSALCFLAIAAVAFSLRDPRRWVRVVWAALTGYVAVCVVLTLYPPYIIPAVLVALALCIGAVLMETGRNGIGLRAALGRLIPIFVAAAIAVVIVLLFFWTRSDTIKAITDTVYPGQRIEPTGGVGFSALLAIFGAPFADGLDGAETYVGLLGPNASEASTPLLLGLFLLIPLIWFVVRDWRENRLLQWMMLGCIGIAGLYFAFLLIPGWTGIARLLLLDRTTNGRIRLGLGLICVVAIALLIRRLDERDVKVPWGVTWGSVGAVATSIILVWSELAEVGDQALVNSEHHRLLAVLIVLSVFLYCRGQALLASLAFLIVSLVLSLGINPLYRGIFDLTDTAMGQDVERINAARPGTWVGIGSFQLSSVLVETGVDSFNGVQLYPPVEMWREVDPDGQFSDVWNRYASVAWEPGTGEPVLRNPQADVVIATFDSCSNFAQQHVTYVMSQDPLDQRCLQQVDQASSGPSTYWFYEVVG